MSMIEQELSSQPDVWLAAGALAETASEQLPARGQRVVVVGCGTSLYMAQAAARWREDAGDGETDAYPASELPGGRRYDLCVAVSRSGTTTEVVELLERVGGRTLLITADPDQPASAVALSTIALPFADEESVVQTRFATGWLALWRAHLGHDVEALAQDGRWALSAPLPDALETRRQFVFLGRGPAAGLASEAALKLREAAGCWTEAYPSMEIRHGPISGVGPDSLVWSLDRLDDGLRGAIAATGAAIVQGDHDPMAELVRVHRVAVQLAEANGLDPDHPRHLARSVILPAPSPAGAASSDR
jgi:fructoselysine-6-P-deglycase FrlB-like protein